MEKYRDDPEYCEVLRTVLKSQIKQLVEQLSFYGGEEAVLLSASISDGTLSHIGSKSGQQFLNAHSHVKSLFLGFCLKGAKNSSATSSEIEKRPEPSTKSTQKPAAKRPRISDSEEFLPKVQSVKKNPSGTSDQNKSHLECTSSHTASATCTKYDSDSDSVSIVGATPGTSLEKTDFESFIEMECVDDTEAYSESIGIFSPEIVKETLAEIKNEPCSDVEVDNETDEPSDLASNLHETQSSSDHHMTAHSSQIKEEECMEEVTKDEPSSVNEKTVKYGNDSVPQNEYSGYDSIKTRNPYKPTKKPEKRSQSQTASVKTVKKWEKELNVELMYNTDKAGHTVVKIWCAVCMKYAHRRDKTSNLVTGSHFVKKESVSYHVKSEAHVRALQVKAAQQEIYNKELTEIQASVQNMDKHEVEKMKYLLNTAYYIATQERPFTDFEMLIQLQKLNTVDLGETYANDNACKKFISEIAEYYFENLKTKLDNSDYFSIFTDETESEKEVIMIKYIDNFYPVTEYLKLEELNNTKAEGFLECVDKAFSDFGMPDYHKKLVGYCSDGASVMQGSKKGVIKLLKDRKNAPWVVSVWCLTHRLELAVKDCFKRTYLDDLIDVLSFLYQFFKESSNRNKEAEQIADIDEEFLKPEQVNGTRWIDHKLRATAKLLRNWVVIICHLENYAEDATNRGEDRAKVKGILKKMLQYAFVWYIHFLKDLLSELATISLVFQRADINVGSAVAKLQASKLVLLHLHGNNGISLTAFYNIVQQEGDSYIFKGHTLINHVPDATLQIQKSEIVQSMLDCLHLRFDNLTSDENFLVCNVFDHSNFPEQDEALLLYGTAEVSKVFTHFRQILENTNVEEEAALREFTDLKLHIVRNRPKYIGLHPLAVFQQISQGDENKGDYKNILKLIHLTSVYPLSNASCEGSYSAMQRVKSDWRAGLTTDTLDRLLRIVLCGPKLKDFKAETIVQRWWSKCPTVAPYGPRN